MRVSLRRKRNARIVQERYRLYNVKEESGKDFVHNILTRGHKPMPYLDTSFPVITVLARLWYLISL